MESKSQILEAEIQSVGQIQHEEFRNFVVKGHGGKYSTEHPNFLAGDGFLNLALFQWTDEHTQKEECHVAEVLGVLFDNSGPKAVKIGADPSGRQIFVYLNDPTIKAFGTIRLDSQPIQATEGNRDRQTHKISAAATESFEAKRFRDVATNRIVQKLVTALALTGTSVALMNTSPTGAAAGFNRNGARTTISAPHVPPFSIKTVTMEKGDTVIGLSNAAVNNHETNLSREEEIREDEVLNAPIAKKFGNFHHIPVGTKVEIVVKPESAPPTEAAKPHEKKPATESVLIKKDDTVFGFAFVRSRESGMSIRSEEAEILKLNPGIKVDDLEIGSKLTVPKLTEPKTHAIEARAPEHKPLTAAQKIATAEFDKLAHDLQIETWATDPNSPIKQGDTVLFQDPQTLKYKVGTVEDIKGVGVNRVLTTDNGNCSVTNVLMRGDSYTETDQTDPKLVVVLPSPTLTPKVVTPYWGINIDSIDNQTPPTSENLHNQIADGVSSDGITQNTPTPAPALAPVEWQNSNQVSSPPQPTPETSPIPSPSSVSSNADVQTAPSSTSAPKPSPVPKPAPQNDEKKFIDCSVTCPSPQAILNAGDMGIQGYLNASGKDAKVMTKAREKKYLSAGVEVTLIYEDDGTEMNKGFSGGAKAGKAAVAEAKELDYTPGTPILFADDTNTTNGQLGVITQFLEGAESTDKDYPVGIYGGYLAVSTEMGNHTVLWGEQTYAWSQVNGHTRWYPGAQFRQVQNHIKLGGGIVDQDVSMVGDDGFMKPTAEPSHSNNGNPAPKATSSSAPTTIINPSRAFPNSTQIHSFIVSPSTNATTHPPAQSSDNNVQIYDYFVNHGFTPHAAAGIVGNTNSESGSQPERLEGTPSGVKTPIESLTPKQLNTKGWNIVQSTPARKYLNWTNQHHLNPDLLSTQEEFVLDGISPSLKKKLNAEPTAGAAAKLFEKDYERPASEADADHRAQVAEKYDKLLDPAAAK